ncbi:expressed unknown protein [Seminavis robusta]|uniref:Uncharacterized protein n=1 Tax=Seminavis robusta TaxID=568900 RepID=A0A9N8DNA5_9STRA|nr:expressed unknown protein [Seminavis robusta]|eukprot:Sro150_g068780.1 n/a (146) ;mRNA; r:41329-41766
MPPVPCPPGQPLFAPPILATSILIEEHDHSHRDDHDDPMDEDGSAPVVQRRCSAPEASSTGHSFSSQDCVKSCKGETGNLGHMFCETKRTAMRQKLHSRDYRLSSDEMVFVEAAVKLSKGFAPPAFAPLTLSKPSLPHHVIQGRF